MFLASLWFAVRRPPFKKYRVLGRIWRIDRVLMRQLIAIGAPISIAFLLEYGLFGAAGLLMGLIGTTALAAHQIALQIAAILFMVPFGIGMAATVRVGHAVGRNDAPAVRRAGLVATLLGIVFMSVMTLAVILGRYAIARFFFGDAAESAGAVIELTAALLLVGATFFVADGIQTVVAGASRSQRHAPAAAVRRDQLLAGRIPDRLRPRLPDPAWSDRRVDRPILRHRGLRGASHSAVPAADAPLASGNDDRRALDWVGEP
jgi:Na+-driven multidrug efflux pump